MKKKPKPSRPTRPRPRKETSDRVSTIAAKVLRRAEGWPLNSRVAALPGPYESLCSLGELVALAASCLSQDEQGKRRGR